MKLKLNVVIMIYNNNRDLLCYINTSLICYTTFTISHLKCFPEVPFFQLNDNYILCTTTPHTTTPHTTNHQATHN